MRQFRPAIVLLVLLTLITGVLYPAVVTGIAQVTMRKKANGSVIEQGSKAFGSTLIGQPFSGTGYFWSRPSATSPAPYNAAAGCGSNLGPSNPALIKAVQDRVAALKAAGPATGPVPVDLVTASGSGLDPHISPAGAHYQVERVAKARALPSEAVRKLVDDHTEGRTLGVLGENRVNILQLNLALDALRTGDAPAAAH